MLEGCVGLYTGRWTLVNLGEELNSVGHELPCQQEVQDDNGRWHYRTRVWKKGERYIVEVPLAFVPFNPPLIEHSAGHSPAKKSLDNRYYGPTKEEIAQYQTEPYYADLSHSQFFHLCKWHKSDFFRNPFPDLKLTPAAETDFNGSVLILDSIGNKTSVHLEEMNQFRGLPHLDSIRTHSIPPRRTGLNHGLQPIRWAAKVVDIPLSLLATPSDGWQMPSTNR
ncbi:MAG: hypothetical protein IJ498_00395 [Akkermansia sp.]|nr:hypothetical protein [Akkermansia sp.]